MIPLRDDQPRFTKPYVTYAIIAVNLAIYLFEDLLYRQSPANLNSLVFEFGMVPRLITHGMTAHSHVNLALGFVTVLTSMFLHGSWPHVIGNMWFLYIFGDNIEDYLGHFSYLMFYLLCGFAGAATHIFQNPASSVPTVGASGAIAGVIGGYFLLYPRAKVLMFFLWFWWMPAWIVIGYWFLVQFLNGTATTIAYAQSQGGVAVWAHIGGFIAGLILIKLLPKRIQRQRYGTW
jgi:membrane associated rhomboid family serine protease